MLILGIETSCDDTGMAIVRDGYEVLASVVSSQIKVHSEYGGVVPELASREHIKNIRMVFDTVLKEAGVKLDDIDLIGVTAGPGLLGSLLVGFSFAKALSFSKNIPFIPLNHIESHIQSAFIEFKDEIKFPVAAFVASGGHTHLFSVTKDRKVELLVKTRDDAVGEAFDKVSKMLGLGYPGGPIVEKLAKDGDEKKYKLPRPKMSDGSDDMSFSGIKTAVLRLIEKEGSNLDIPSLCASFQKTVADIMIHRVNLYDKQRKFKSVLFTGGVSANSYIKERFNIAFTGRCYIPPFKYSTDNGAMVASYAFEKKDIDNFGTLHEECFSTANYG